MKNKEFYVGHINDEEERLCTVHASHDKLKLLSFVHLLYHSLINDPFITDAYNRIRHPSIVQSRAEDVCKNLKHFFVGTNDAVPSSRVMDSNEDFFVHPTVGEPQAEG